MPIPSSLVCNRIPLTWSDVLWGYKRQLLGWSTVVDFAIARMSAEASDPLEIELAGLQKSETHRVGELLQELASKEKTSDSELSKYKWLYLSLVSLFESRATVSDPLGEVETIYADFDYPSEITGFVRYMPVTDGYDPSRHSKAENEERLFEQWRLYLNNAGRELGASN